jgi:hypothetical protein
VQRGWNFSTHELWKLLVLPYLDNTLVRRLIANGERARTWDAKYGTVLFCSAPWILPNGEKPCGLERQSKACAFSGVYPPLLLSSSPLLLFSSSPLLLFSSSPLLL